MTTRDEVNLWWINKNFQPDPRGPSPGLLYFYSYSSNHWINLFKN